MLGKLLDKIGEFLFIRHKKQEIIHKIPKEGEIENLAKDIQKEMAFKEGELAKAKSKLAEYEEKEKKQIDEKKLAKKISDRAKEYNKQNYRGAFSLRKFFNDIIIKNRAVEVLSYDEKKSFGKLYDIIVLQNGMMGISILNKDNKKAVLMAAPSPNYLFANYKGLGNSARRRNLRVNLTAEREYFYNPLDEKIPRVVYVEGQPVQLTTQDYLINQLIEVQAENQEILNQLALAENALAKEHSYSKTSTLGSALNLSRAKMAENIVSQNVSDMAAMNKTYADALKENSRLAVALKIAEDRGDKLDDIQEEILDEIKEVLKKPEYELAKRHQDEMGNALINKIIDVISVAKEIPVKSPEPAAEETVENRELPKKF